METATSRDLGSDAYLVEAARAGSHEALAMMIERHHGRMARVAFLTCRDQDLAEDAVQAAWVKAWKRIADLRDPDRLAGWLIAIAANEARQLARRRRRYAATALEEPVGDTRDSIGDLVDLDRALAALAPEDRSLIALRHLGGLTSAEIATAWHQSPSAVRGRLARAMARLRREMDR